MKIKDYISKNIQEYPSIFKAKNYEESKLLVLNHTFFVFGTGLELAKTKNVKQGGYVTYPKLKKHIRQFDLKYGKETYMPIPNDYFETKLFYICNYPELKNIFTINGVTYFKYDSNKFKFGTKPIFLEASTEEQFYPYPFSKEYSLVCKIFYEDLFLQEDWLKELINLVKRALIYFENPEEYKSDCKFPSEKRIQKEVIRFQEVFEKEGSDGIIRLKELWNYPVVNFSIDFEEIEKNINYIWEQYKTKQIDFLNKFLEKYVEEK